MDIFRIDMPSAKQEKITGYHLFINQGKIPLSVPLLLKRLVFTYQMHEKQVIEHAPISTHVRNKTENNCKMQFCVILRNKVTLTPFFKYICFVCKCLAIIS